MADYKNYFSDWNPLNLYQGGKGNLPFTSYTLRQDGTIADKVKSAPKTVFESDDEYNTRLQKEEEDYQDYVKRQKEYTQQLESQKWQARTQRELHPENGIINGSLDQQAEKDVMFATDPATGNFRNPALLLKNQWQSYSQKLGDYEDAYNNITNLSAAFVGLNPEEDNRENSYISKLENEVMQDWKNRGFIENEAQFFTDWNDIIEEDRLTLITSALGRKYFKGEALDEFINADDQTRFDMLASYLKNNEFYESQATKQKKEIDWSNNIFSKDWKEATDHVTNRFLRGITGNSSNIVEGFADIVGGGVMSAIGNMGNLLGGLVGSAGEYIQSRVEGGGFKEDVDDFVAERANAYINQKSEALYQAIQANSTPEEKKEIIDRFDAMSLDASPWYRAEKGTSLTELTDAEGDDAAEFNEKLREYANIATVALLYDDNAARNNLKEFWENTIAGNQTATDRILRTAGTFGNTMAADAAAFAGIIANPIFMAFNPEDQSIEGEGYSDALVRRNPLVTWANNLQETGSWTTKGQNKYKELGVNALQIYKDVSDQNSFLAWNDLYDIVGQYGFTAATTALSLGGSAAVKSMASNLAKNSLRNGTRGTIARGLIGKEARQALKLGLAEEATEAEITAAKEMAAKIAASTMYKGNLTVGAMMGTAEGALEAKSTYNTFIKDNAQIMQQFDERQRMLDNATDADLKNYMISAGYSPAYFTNGPEGTAVSEFSPEQYRQARSEIQKNIDEARQAAKERIEDNAADAAAVNLISNSAINGFLNLFFKEAVMSRDVREASRIAQGKNKFSDLIDVVKKGDSWEAVIKKAVKDNGKRNLWQAAKNVAGKTAKNALGEFGEEYSQGISDQAAREALQYDLNQYINTVFDKDSREAFQTDWEGMLNTGLNSILTNATDQENLKAGVFGALSSIIGGLSPAGIGATFKGFASGRTEKDKGVWGTTKWIGRNLSNLYQGGVQQALRDYNEEYQTAVRLAESTNAWLGSEKNQELLTHMGGAGGFKKAIEDAIIAGDDFNAHDGKLGLAVENIFMLQALKDTDYGRVMQEKLKENTELLDLVQDDENFDSNGNYVGNQQQEEGEQDWVRTAINTYRNQLGDATRTTNLTDRQIMQRVGENASGLLELQNKVISAQQRVRNIFGNDNIDPLAERAFVYALMSQENTRERRDNLATKLQNSIDNDNLSDTDKETLKQSGLDQATIDFIVEHGSLEKAQKAQKSLEEQANREAENANNKKLSKEQRQQARKRAKYLDRQASVLGRQIAAEERRRTPLEPVDTGTNEESEEETVTLTTPTIFSAGDIAAMPNQQKAYVIANKEKYSTEQQKAIDDFLTISRKNIAAEDNDIALTNEEVAKDYIDLATLQRRADAYDQYLVEYINNPSFLTTTATTQREAERTRTLKRLYKEDLQMRPRESVLEFKERLDKKVQSLKDQNKYEDASILNKLINENEQVAKLHTNLFEAEKAVKIYQLLQNVSQGDADKLAAVVETLVANSGLSLKEIKGLLDASDTTTIVRHLSQKTSDGQRSLNKTMAKRGLSTFDFTNDAVQDEEMLAPTVQDIKTFVDFYSNVLNDKSEVAPEVRPKVVDNESSGQSQKKEPKIPNNPQGSVGGQRTENSLITITAPGAIDQNSALGRFLEVRGVSENVKNIDNVKNPNVQFVVIKAFGQPVVFAVQAIPKSKAIKGKTVEIGGNDYQIIGVVLDGQSDTLTELGKQTYNELMPDEEGRLLATSGGPINTQFSHIKDSKFMSEQHQEEAINLNEIYTTDDAIDSYARDLVNYGTRTKPIEGKNGEKEEKSKLLDSTNHAVEIDDDPEKALNYLGNFPINGTTLQEILQSIDFTDPDSIKNAINTLKSNEYFRAFFEAWTDRTLDTTYGGVRTVTLDNKAASNLYQILLGDFLFLGYPYPNTERSSKESYLNPRLTSDGNQISIDGWNKQDSDSDNWSGFVFELPFGKSTAEREQLALEVLSGLLRKDANEQSVATLNFQFANTQLGNKHALGSSNEGAKKREIQRIKGMIKAGILKGYAVSAVDRLMQVPNPFASKTTSTKSNNKNASQINPAPRGTVTGGRVNPEDGTVEQGNPKTPREVITTALTDAQKKAQQIVDRIVTASKAITQENHNSETYEGNGTHYSRVTSAKQAYIGAATEPFDASEDVGNLSHAYGNTVDPVIRAALEILNQAVSENKHLSNKELLKEILKDEAFKGKEHIPNWSDYQMGKFLDQIISFHTAVRAKGWTIVPKDIRAFGTADVFNGQIKIGKLPIAGTLDLLAYDKNGKFHIIDIKTVHLTDNGESVLVSHKAEWEAQVSSYQGTLQQQNADMEFEENYIFPVFLSYSMPSGVTVEVEDDDMTVKNYRPTSEPKLKIKPGQDSYQLEDFLYPIDTLEFRGYEYDRLSDADKTRIIPSTAAEGPIVGSSTPSGTSEAPAAPMSPNAGTNAQVTIGSALDDIPWDSRRTTRQARYTEFINNHIAPIAKARIGIVSRAASVIKSLFNKEGKQIILKKELANIFFNGDDTKLELVLRGQKVTESNLPEITRRLRSYYESYIQNSDRYIANITRRYNISKAVCDYLKGNITQQQLEEELTKYQTSLGNVAELVEYMTAANKEEAATKILNRIETSRVNTKEKYDEDLQALNATIESMQAKLDFLNTSSAVEMLTSRVNSVQEAIENGSYEEYTYKKSAAIEDLLKTKSGSYGAMKLLRGISLRTKNANFKKLANILLRQIKEKNLTIPITVEDGSLNFVEGTTKGRSITIQKTSLDTYEHLERVLLHEMLHAVVEASPEMRETLQQLLKQATLNIQKHTGKTESQVKKEYYGLSNVDEFISEFFTNYAFQETLKTLGNEDSGNTNYGNIFDRFIGVLKEKFTGDKSLYNQISEAMEKVLGSTNIESTYKSTERESSYARRNKFSDLNSDLQQTILSRGISKEEFNDMTSIEQEHLKACCK